MTAVTTSASVIIHAEIATVQNASHWLAPNGWMIVDLSFSTPSIFMWSSPHRSPLQLLPFKTRRSSTAFCSGPPARRCAPSQLTPSIWARKSDSSRCFILGVKLFFTIRICIAWFRVGGISPDGTRWISCRRKFFLPVLVLARLFRRLFLDYLRKAFDAGDLQFFSSLESLRTRDAFLRHIAPIQKKDWVVYAKRPFAGPEQVLKYVARYTHRIAISNNRLLDIDDGKVQFRWKDYRNGHRQKTMTLGADEFIRRFLLHVLPDGFQRIRYFGFLANRYRAEKLALCRQLMQMSPPTATRKVSMDYRDRYEVLTGVSLKTCPLCRSGTMVVIETFECTANRAPIMDTS